MKCFQIACSTKNLYPPLEFSPIKLSRLVPCYLQSVKPSAVGWGTQAALYAVKQYKCISAIKLLISYKLKYTPIF